MKNTFVLDENVILLAEIGQDERGNPDIASSKVIEDIASRCHAIALDHSILEKYLKKGSRAPRVIRILMRILRDPRKLNYLDNVNPIQHESKVPHKDLQFVRVSVQAHAILVTTDGPLATSLKRDPMAATYNIAVLRPEEAIPHAQSPCP